jgi:ketosteroid isomerase-like protein
MIAKKPEPYTLADAVRDIFDAFSRRDMAGLQRTGSPDIVLHIPGKSSLAGTHRGIGEVIAIAARAATRFVPTSLQVLSVEAEGNDATAVVELAGRSPDGTVGTVRLTQRFRFDEQVKVVETWLEPEDQRQFDRLVG